MNKKTCTRCGMTKPAEDFRKRNKGKTDVQCKACAAKEQREWYEKNKTEAQIRRNVTRLTNSLNQLQDKASSVGQRVTIEIGPDHFIKVTTEKL